MSRTVLALPSWTLAAALLAAPVAFGQEPTPEPEPAPPEEAASRPTGLPHGLDWTFHFDASLGAFGFAHSLYTDPRPEEPSGNLGDNWMEGAMKPALTGTFTSAKSWQIYGTLSAVGERTFAAPPSLIGEDASSFKVEDLSVGWRSGTAVGSTENVLDLTLGRAPYQLGHGLLLWDGAAEGGTRGGYWSNARKAFEFAAIGRFRPGHHALEAFYLDKDDLPEADTGSRLFGANYEYAVGDHSTIGATYMKWRAYRATNPRRDGLNVYNARLFAAPPRLKGFSLELEYAREANGDRLESNAWNGLVGYELPSGWKPKLSYRYAYFEGDDPATRRSEGFDPLFTGFHDWGSWWQGEIAGEYFVSNSNLISHQVRLHLSPNESLGTGVLLYKFLADRPAALGPEVTARDIALEGDWYMDWKINGNFTLSVVAAFADPGKVVQQLYDRTKTFAYGMVYVAYSY